jgi:hypothetical protein
MTAIKDRDPVLTTPGGREYWREVLAAGGFTPVLRWAPEPAAGVLEREARIPVEHVAAPRRLGAPLRSVLLARAGRAGP